MRAASTPAFFASARMPPVARLGFTMVSEHFLIATTMLVVGLFAVAAIHQPPDEMLRADAGVEGDADRGGVGDQVREGLDSRYPPGRRVPDRAGGNGS